MFSIAHLYNSAPKVPNLTISPKSRLLGGAVMLRPPASKPDTGCKACIATVAIFVNPWNY